MSEEELDEEELEYLRRKRSLRRKIKHLLQAAAIIGALETLRFLPLSFASAFGSILFRTICPLFKADRVAKENLARAFPDWDQQQIQKTVTEVWDNLGRGAGEFSHVRNIDPTDPDGPVEVVGLEHLTRAADQGGFVVMSAHMANWEIAGLVCARYARPFNAIYRFAENPWMDRYFQHIRSSYSNKLLPKGVSGIRMALSGLRKGEPLGLLLDQKLNEGVPVPFFGRDAMTASAPVEMSLALGVPLLPARLERVAKGPKFRITIYPPMDPPETGDRREDARQILIRFHDMLEGWIRERPGQWFWVHRRWPKE